jgi:hypothetical protein
MIPTDTVNKFQATVKKIESLKDQLVRDKQRYPSNHRLHQYLQNEINKATLERNQLLLAAQSVAQNLNDLTQPKPAPSTEQAQPELVAA